MEHGDRRPRVQCLDPPSRSQSRPLPRAQHPGAQGAPGARTSVYASAWASILSRHSRRGSGVSGCLQNSGSWVRAEKVQLRHYQLEGERGSARAARRYRLLASITEEPEPEPDAAAAKLAAKRRAGPGAARGPSSGSCKAASGCEGLTGEGQAGDGLRGHSGEASPLRAFTSNVENPIASASTFWQEYAL